MGMSRKHFTALAELVGAVEAGRIAPTDIRQAVIDDIIAPEPQASFKPDVFARHADKEREFQVQRADQIVPGTTFQYSGLVLRADDVHKVPIRIDDLDMGNACVRITCSIEGDHVLPGYGVIVLEFAPNETL